MSATSDLETGTAPVQRAYTRAAVDEYVWRATARQAELHADIRDARARVVRADAAAERITSLERAVGASVVAAYAKAESGRRERAGAPADTEAETAVDADPVEVLDDDKWKAFVATTEAEDSDD